MHDKERKNNAVAKPKDVVPMFSAGAATTVQPSSRTRSNTKFVTGCP